jgi:hypothetical protein
MWIRSNGPSCSVLMVEEFEDRKGSVVDDTKWETVTDVNI